MGVGELCFFQCSSVFHEGEEFARVEESGYFREPLSVGLNEEEGVFGALRSAAWDAGYGSDEATAGVENIPGALQRFAADGVEYEIDVSEVQVESGASVVDDLVGSQFFYERNGRGSGGRDDMGAEGFCELHGEEADSSGTPVDEDSLAGAEIAVSCEPLPCGERSDGDGGSLLVGKRLWFIRNRGGRGDTVLGERTLLVPVVHAKDGFPYCDVFDSVASGADIAGKFVGGDGVLSGGAVGLMGGGLPLEFSCDDSCGAHANEQFSLPGFGHWTLVRLEREAFGRFEYLHDFHKDSSLADQGLLYGWGGGIGCAEDEHVGGVIAERDTVFFEGEDNAAE